MIIIMILTSLILGIIFVILFITNNNKFEDYEPFSIRILIED
ncbi:cbb3-type cytochrome oxidase assembly protein [Candidatus Karelsulcia muelleri]|uniref:Cbb3-type cytochrome oxidase assembly protein CcoS n=2 Tax=Candidatus Karelsulcia muelleri TaxID=336810 RepID=A8Z606_KARMG|nr:cbb3-type cytochrome oxidase assembly protein [Candidatus Karelsulcia muelleri]ABS30557.1 hypothetical protein SMGWSS_149 [Candidatus Karelsulcia muelleri GWSS]ADE35433.1 Cytochrome oxidase maturation protein cbb3-type [Candidatus Karelsulcia muelleri DMIN]MBU6942175.1 cbb3-type cytochrome oxidase assembly protein [Candidatus Karelsulcia muelleri]